MSLLGICLVLLTVSSLYDNYMGRTLKERPVKNKLRSRGGLTLREIEYLSLVAMGFKNYEIANILSVTISTVKKTLETIFDKLNAVDRANAVSIAFVHKLLDDVVLSQISNKYNTQDYKTL